MKTERNARPALRFKIGLTAVLLITVMISAFALRSTLAWLSSSDARINTFKPGSVTTEIEEEFDGETKTDVKIRNTGTAPAYIRAALVPAWTTENGDLAARTVDPADYDQNLNMTDWFKAGDYYYYKHVVPAGQLTTNLINSFEILSFPPDLVFELQVISSGIQSDPAAAVESSWPAVQVVNGLLAPAGGGTP